MHVVADCRNAEWANSCLGCTNVVRKHYSQLVGASFPVVQAVWVQNGCLLADNADYPPVTIETSKWRICSR